MEVRFAEKAPAALGPETLNANLEVLNLKPPYSPKSVSLKSLKS